MNSLRDISLMFGRCRSSPSALDWAFDSLPHGGLRHQLGWRVQVDISRD